MPGVSSISLDFKLDLTCRYRQINRRCCCCHGDILGGLPFNHSDASPPPPYFQKVARDVTMHDTPLSRARGNATCWKPKREKNFFSLQPPR